MIVQCMYFSVCTFPKSRATGALQGRTCKLINEKERVIKWKKDNTMAGRTCVA